MKLFGMMVILAIVAVVCYVFGLRDGARQQAANPPKHVIIESVPVGTEACFKQCMRECRPRHSIKM